MNDNFKAPAFSFFKILKENNSRDWWLEHKAIYQSTVLGPLKGLTSALEADFGHAHIFRPNRDIRFSHDKSPYKLNASFFIESKHSVGGLYFELGEAGIFVGGGLYEPQSDQLDRWRHLFNSEKGSTVKKAITKAKANGLELSFEQIVKTAPRGWDKHHPEIEFIRLKNAVIGKGFSPEAVIEDPAFTKTIVKTFHAVEEWNQMLSELVGPSTLPPKW